MSSSTKNLPRGNLRNSLQRYEGGRGNSGVSRYAIGNDYIIVEFRSEEGYLYTYAKPGRIHVEAMKKLAASGHGLATYINRHVQADYAEKLW